MDAIFTFHSIDVRGSVLSYAPDDLRRLAEGLLTEGVRLVPLDVLLDPAPEGPPRAALTFDDGFRSVHSEALPVLDELGVPATVYVVSDRVGGDNRWPGQGKVPRFELLSWSELAELRDAGFAIGCHTANHVRLDRLAEAEWGRELEDSKRVLADELGTDVRHFAYPYGAYDRRVLQRVSELYDTAVTTEMRFLPESREPHRLPRIDTYYLRDPARRLPVFGARTRRYLAARAFLRDLRALFAG